MASHNHDIIPNNNLYAYNYGGDSETAVPIAGDVGKTVGRYYQTISTSSSGGSRPFNIVQPYQVVGYMWRRIA